MVEKSLKIFSVLFFFSVFFSYDAKDVTPISKRPHSQLLGTCKAQDISNLKVSSTVESNIRPILRGGRRFLYAGGFYRGPNFPSRYYHALYNHPYPIPYHFNKGFYLGRTHLNTPYNLFNKNKYILNRMHTLLPYDFTQRGIVTEYPFVENGNQFSFENNGNFYPIYNMDDQYNQINPFIQQYPFNDYSYFSDSTYNGKENLVPDETNIIKKDGSNKGLVEGTIVVIEPNMVIEDISNSTPEKEVLAVEGASVISQNAVAHTANGGSVNEEYITKGEGNIDNSLKNKEVVFYFDGTNLDETNVMSQETGSHNNVNPNLPLHTFTDGKIIEKYIKPGISQQTGDEKLTYIDGKFIQKYIKPGIPQQTGDEEFNQKLDSSGIKGTDSTINTFVDGKFLEKNHRPGISQQTDDVELNQKLDSSGNKGTNLTLHTFIDGKFIDKYIKPGIFQQTGDGKLNQKLDSSGIKGSTYYIVKGSTQDDSKGHSYRKFLTPFYRGNTGFGSPGTFIGGGIGQPTGFNGFGINNRGTAVSSGAIGIRQNAAGIYESASVNGAASISTGSGIGGLPTSGQVSVSGQVGINEGIGVNGGYSSGGGAVSVGGGVGLGNGGGLGRGVGIGEVPNFGGGVGLSNGGGLGTGVGIGGVPSFGGGIGIGGSTFMSGDSINGAAGFNGGGAIANRLYL